MSTRNQIKERIEQGERGKFYFAEDFLDISNDEQVRLALSRLAKEGILIRPAQGIYYFPKIDPIIGVARPGMEEIAQAIAQKERIKIRPTGAYALNKLGLSSQVPMKIAFFTNGKSRKIKVGKREIQFINRSPKRMAYEGIISGDVFIAMEELGEENLTDDFLNVFLGLLGNESPSNLFHDIKLTPRWIRNKFYGEWNKSLLLQKNNINV